jgi:hypothetical protein
MEKVFKVLVILGTVVMIAVIMALPTMWLWNWLIPTIFNLIEITFWQALGLNILCGILFKPSSSN